jgi:hypothetical protein
MRVRDLGVVDSFTNTEFVLSKPPRGEDFDLDVGCVRTSCPLKWPSSPSGIESCKNTILFTRDCDHGRSRIGGIATFGGAATLLRSKSDGTVEAAGEEVGRDKDE